ncbi:MAG: AMP-binding protein [Proteobacteria bacterium]|nr:AMP-binding protein [Pseudomonadota bacterium]HQR04759.1 AMP-binding protein [Rhodocyclaceae bacterium]
MNPSAPSAHIDLFVRDHLPPPAQWPELLAELPELNYPDRINCAAELLDRAVDMHGWGERIALRGPAGTLTYRELRETADRIARVLTEDMGLVPGNRVLLHAANSAFMAACWFAILKAGGIVVTTVAMLRVKELTEIVSRARISHALCDHALRDELERTRERVPGLLGKVAYLGGRDGLEQAAATQVGGFKAVDTRADDPALIAFTSGTTGCAKGTVHFHRDVLAVCDCFPRYLLKPVPEDIFCSTSALGFTFGLGGGLLFPLRYGASAVIGNQSLPETLLQTIQDYCATICFSVPTAYRMAATRAGGFDLGSLRASVCAGEPLTRATRDAWWQATGLDLIDGIGSTEMLHIFISAAGPDIRPGATGRPVPGYRATVLDDQGNSLPPGQVGRLAIKGPTGCRYLDDPRQADYVQQGWNITGDAYSMDAEGYFHFHARVDDMIISAGHNISGPEVEDALLRHPAVAECAVIGVPDEIRGQMVKALVVLGAGLQPGPELVTELQEHVRRQIAAFKYPRLIEFRDSLPRTETGKLQRFKLRQEALKATQPAAPVKRHEVVQPEGWAPPRGFSNGIKARGTYVSIAGQVGWDGSKRFCSSHFTDQAHQALQNVVAVVHAAGGLPEHIVRLTWFVTDKREYLAQSRELGQVYRSVMGRCYPPMTVVQVAALVEDEAKVEIEATAVIPD